MHCEHDSSSERCPCQAHQPWRQPHHSQCQGDLWHCSSGWHALIHTWNPLFCRWAWTLICHSSKRRRCWSGGDKWWIRSNGITIRSSCSMKRRRWKWCHTQRLPRTVLATWAVAVPTLGPTSLPVRVRTVGKDICKCEEPCPVCLECRAKCEVSKWSQKRIVNIPEVCEKDKDWVMITTHHTWYSASSVCLDWRRKLKHCSAFTAKTMLCPCHLYNFF